jgi:hypothetical protein
MGKQKSTVQILYVNNICQLKFILFTILILISSLLYFNEIFAINENNKKLILNASSGLFDNNNNNVPFLGHTFSNITNITNNTYDSLYGQIAAIDNKVSVVWQDTDSLSNKKNLSDKKILSSIIFRGSTDNGNTFDDEIEIVDNTYDAYPKVNSYQNSVYVVWNSENKGSAKDYKNTGLFFIRSSDNGKNFDNSIRLVDNNFGESQILVLKDELVIV